MEAVSVCSPIVLSRVLGFRDKMRTTGRLVVSCLIFSSDETRYVVKQESLRGRNGIYAESSRSPSATADSRT